MEVIMRTVVMMGASVDVYSKNTGKINPNCDNQ
jgi:hypothetical protein